MGKGTMQKGIFFVVDGLDGVGKGTIGQLLIAYEKQQGRRVFDTVAYSIAHHRLPELSQCCDSKGVCDTLVTAEPTFSGIGRIIREEMVARTGRSYSFSARIQAYSLDRLVQMQALIIPALSADMRIIQSRCMAATLSYQALQAQEEGREVIDVRTMILQHEGNILQLRYRPDLLIIPTINNIDELMRRIEARKIDGKDDNCVFENPEFQRKLKPFFEDIWLRQLFECYGTTVAYVDTGISIEETKRQALEIYKKFLGQHNP